MVYTHFLIREIHTFTHFEPAFYTLTRMIFIIYKILFTLQLTIIYSCVINNSGGKNYAYTFWKIFTENAY